tara:strand:+ start:194 stop:775 length:582 start_codon:yes stop_codon:yes gene_type:complete
MKQRSIYEIFEEVKRLGKFNEKVAALKENDNAALRTILQYFYHPEIEFLLPKGDKVPYTPSNDPIGTSLSSLFFETKKLYLYVKPNKDLPWLKCNPNLKQTRREFLFIQLLEAVPQEEARILIDMINKKKIMKIPYSVVCEAFPDLLPFDLNKKKKEVNQNDLVLYAKENKEYKEIHYKKKKDENKRQKELSG